MWITFVAKIAKTLENRGKNLKDILIENYLLVKKEPIFAIIFKNK
jgi:hypothetical protein